MKFPNNLVWYPGNDLHGKDVLHFGGLGMLYIGLVFPGIGLLVIFLGTLRRNNVTMSVSVKL